MAALAETLGTLLLGQDAANDPLPAAVGAAASSGLPPAEDRSDVRVEGGAAASSRRAPAPALPAGAEAPRGLRVFYPDQFARLPAAEQARGPWLAHAVWRAPRASAPVVGIHCGPHCCRHLEARLEGAAFVRRRDLLRGAANVEAALVLFEAPRNRWNLAPPVIFVWPQ